jgi:hypothetical protein
VGIWTRDYTETDKNLKTAKRTAANNPIIQNLKQIRISAIIPVINDKRPFSSDSTEGLVFFSFWVLLVFFWCSSGVLLVFFWCSSGVRFILCDFCSYSYAFFSLLPRRGTS